MSTQDVNLIVSIFSFYRQKSKEPPEKKIVKTVL